MEAESASKIIETNTVDLWKIQPFTPEDNPHSFLEKSSFSVLFPKYREPYLKGIFASLKSELENKGVDCAIDYPEGTIQVSTTPKTWDPYIIIKSRDLIKLLSRSVPFDEARKILEDENFCEIINIKSGIQNSERFIKRRARLLGPEGNTLKALQMLCGCYIRIQGSTASVIGTPKAIKIVKDVIHDTMHNIHPIYNIKALMIKRELSKDDSMATEDWSKLIPKFKSTTHQKKVKKSSKRHNSEFPPLPTMSKVDLQLESGEYFLKKREKRENLMAKKIQKQEISKIQKKTSKENIYNPPKEENKFETTPATLDTTISAKELAKTIEKAKKKRFSAKSN